jgi:hypothetical protein
MKGEDFNQDEGEKVPLSKTTQFLLEECRMLLPE